MAISLTSAIPSSVKNAEYAINAGHASSADNATNATKAGHAVNADSAESATNSSTASFLRPSGSQISSWTSSLTDNNSTGRSWYGFGTYHAGDGYDWFNLSNFWGINITVRDQNHLQLNGNTVYNKGNLSFGLSGSTLSINSGA